MSTSHSNMTIPFNENFSFRYILNKSSHSLGRKNNMECQIRHSIHSQIRASQRGIDYETLLLVLDFGTPFYRQGMVFYTVLKKDIPKKMSHGMRKKIKNLVVLLGNNGMQIVTCYRAKNAIKYLRKKTKTLIRS